MTPNSNTTHVYAPGTGSAANKATSQTLVNVVPTRAAPADGSVLPMAESRTAVPRLVEREYSS